MKFFFKKRSKTVAALTDPLALQEEVPDKDHKPDEIASVIALALHLYINRVREYENSIITMQKVMKPYSPWSSKIYGIRHPIVHTVALKPKSK